jgi:hypothetical protein
MALKDHRGSDNCDTRELEQSWKRPKYITGRLSIKNSAEVIQVKVVPQVLRII